MDDMMIMNDRSISLNAALDAVNANNGILYDNPTLVASICKILSALPSAQPSVSKTEIVGDVISRAAAINALDRLEYTPGEWATNGLTMCKDAITALPSAQPDIPGINVIIGTIKNAINASTGNEAYMVGLRNGMRWCLAALTDKEPEYEDMAPAQPGWIPWDSGKFPEESGMYTVTAYDGATKRVTYAKYQKRLKRWELTGARAYWRVLAWMPHIEPWEGGQDGNT